MGVFYTFFLGIVEMRVVVASLKWCPISERTVYSSSIVQSVMFEQRRRLHGRGNLKLCLVMCTYGDLVKQRKEKSLTYL